MGHLSDRIGRRLALTIGRAGFSLLSLITALATNLPEMIGVRVPLGVLQGLYIPTYLAFVGGTFEKRRGFWIEGLVGMCTIGSAINPLTTRAIFNASGGAWQAPSLIYGIFGLLLAAGVFASGSGGIYDRARTRHAADDAAATTAAPPAFEPWRSQGQGFSLEAATTAASLAGWGHLCSGVLRRLDQRSDRAPQDIDDCWRVAARLAYPLFAWTTSFWIAVGVGAVFGACNGAFFGLGVAYAQDLARAGATWAAAPA